MFNVFILINCYVQKDFESINILKYIFFILSFHINFKSSKYKTQTQKKVLYKTFFPQSEQKQLSYYSYLNEFHFSASIFIQYN